MIIEQQRTLLYPEAVPTDLKLLPQWVLWRYERANSGKVTKIPYQCNGKKAASDDPATWATFDAVLQAAEALTIASALRYSGVGFVFRSADDFVGVDLDDCILPNGSLTDKARAIVQALNTYCEISPSGQGLKLWARGSIPASVKNDAEGVEMYASARFFTVTGNRWQGTPPTINAAEAVLLELHHRYKPVPTAPKGKPTRIVSDPFVLAMAASGRLLLPDDRPSVGKVEAALRAVARSRWDDYGQWLDLGMALHSWDSGSAGLLLWDRFSRQSAKYHEGDCERKWQSFDGHGVTIATLLGLANSDDPEWFTRYWQGVQR